MAKISSKPLREYLENAGVIDASAEVIAHAKAQYRREYKRKWKSTNAIKYKFILLKLNISQYKQLSIRARLNGLNPTKYALEVVLTAQEPRNLIPYRYDLLSILQKVGIAISYCKNEDQVQTLLIKAEKELLQYLNHDRQGTDKT
jgi:predicted RNA-binding protein